MYSHKHKENSQIQGFVKRHKHGTAQNLICRVSRCLSDLRQVAAGHKHSADPPTGARLRWRNPPPLGRFGHPGLLQPSLRVPAPGLHWVVSSCVTVKVRALYTVVLHPELGLAIRGQSWSNTVTASNQRWHHNTGIHDRHCFTRRVITTSVKKRNKWQK